MDKANRIAVESREDAKTIGLRYTSDQEPGIVRKKAGKNFAYFDAKGRTIKDKRTLLRIKRLVIPPGWNEVWISAYENGHLQATGRDSRNRKQYRYHPEWRVYRDKNKFERIIGFAKILPKIRRQVTRHLKLKGLPREKVLATIIRLLETTLIRVGNEEYARANNSYGLTTMLNRHAKIRKDKVSFLFTGKSGKKHAIDVDDRYLAGIVKKCQDLPGQELFAYLDEKGKPCDVKSEDVNRYLREIAGGDYTVKDFRTWAGTVLAAIALREFKDVISETRAKKNIVAAIEAVARMLGNTPAVCRKCYVHPMILDSYLEGITIEVLRERAGKTLNSSFSQLKPEEAAVLVLLKKRFKNRKRNARVSSSAFES